MSKFSVEWTRDRSSIVNDVTVDWEEECTINYYTIGSYRPAILYPIDRACPAEYPELEIESIETHRQKMGVGPNELVDILDELDECELEQANARVERDYKEMEDE